MADPWRVRRSQVAGHLVFVADERPDAEDPGEDRPEDGQTELGEKLDDPLQMYLSDIFTISANLAGIPAMSIPCGQSQDNLPIGLQLMGKHFDEAMLLNVAHQYQHTTDHHLQHPVL